MNQDIAYAKLAGLPPQYGLCKSDITVFSSSKLPTIWISGTHKKSLNILLHLLTEFVHHLTLCLTPPPIADSSFVPPLIYALMGSSRDIAMLLGTLLQAEVDPVKNPEEYRQLAFTATFFAGVTEAALGFFR
jgi:MFS superfamily sulfate permease-like transporter